MKTFKQGQRIIYIKGKTAFSVEYVQPVGNQRHVIKFFTPDGYKTMIVHGNSLEVNHDDAC